MLSLKMIPVTGVLVEIATAFGADFFILDMFNRVTAVITFSSCKFCLFRFAHDSLPFSDARRSIRRASIYARSEDAGDMPDSHDRSLAFFWASASDMVPA